MKTFHKYIALIVAFACVISILPVAYAAENTDSALSISESYVNPLYADLLTEEDLDPLRMSRVRTSAEDGYLSTPEDAGRQLREGMLQRNPSIVIYYKTDGYDGNPDTIRTLLHEIAEESFRHTGVPTEGDYLMWQYGGWNANAQAAASNDIYYWTFTYTLTYYTTLDQEEALTEKVNEVLASLEVDSQSDYRKIKAVYDYICSNVVYDHAHLNDPNYKRQFTAYAALIDGTSVCQGYALLLYRMALSLDVDCRLISGLSRNQGHGWNIVKLDGLYYNLDSTWDCGDTEYTYFLRTMNTFGDHTRDQEYDTPEFHRAYPMATQDYVPSVLDACTHNYTSETIEPGCLSGGYTTNCCSSCGHCYTDQISDALGHDWDEGTITQSPTDLYPGALLYICRRCDASKTEFLPAAEDVYRIFGDNRYETAFKAAETLKEIYGIEKFDTILVASGNEFADALSGSYLAVRKNAPLLLVNPRMVSQVADYIRENLQQDGTVYLLGGPAAVPAEMESALNGLQVIRLQGSNRYETNLAILREAGMDGSEILICTGKDFADSLSASALGKPILLVKNTLLDSQKAFLGEQNGIDFYIIGGENAISMELADELVAFGQGARIAGANRYETSVNIASVFAPDCHQIVAAYGHNFPDGLCGGVLAAAIKAPLILTRDRNVAYAAEYAALREIRSGIVLGGSGLINDETVRTIFSIDETRDILLK